MHIHSFVVWKNACLNYREFDLEKDLVGEPHTCYLSAQSFIKLVKLVWREYEHGGYGWEEKEMCQLQRTWVSKRTVLPKKHNLDFPREAWPVVKQHLLENGKALLVSNINIFGVRVLWEKNMKNDWFNIHKTSLWHYGQCGVTEIKSVSRKGLFIYTCDLINSASC